MHLEYVGGPELLSKWVGETEAALRRVFAAAESHAPSVVFLDEIDALGARRSRFDAADACHVQQLLSLMDGLEHQPGVLVIGATNRIEAIDPALLRPGRFGLVLEVPAPDAATRARIVGIHLGGKPVEGELDLDAIARLTEGFSGAQLMALCQEAAQAALEREVATGEGQVVSQLDLVRARGRIAESGRGGD